MAQQNIYDNKEFFEGYQSLRDNLSANEYNNLRSKIGWDTKDIEVVQNAIKNTKGKNHSYFNFYSN